MYAERETYSRTAVSPRRYSPRRYMYTAESSHQPATPTNVHTAPGSRETQIFASRNLSRISALGGRADAVMRCLPCCPLRDEEGPVLRKVSVGFGVELHPVAEPLSSPAPGPAAVEAPNEPLTWGAAKPLGASVDELPPEVAEVQLRGLAEARQLVDGMKVKYPQMGSPSGDVINVSLKAHKHSPTVFDLDLHFDGSWNLDVVVKIRDHGAGLLPVLSMLHEADLLPEYLPKPPGLPHLEKVRIGHRFTPTNDLVYHVNMAPWGPFPGADDIHAALLFDLLDEPEGALLLWAKSPAEGASAHRGWPIPPVTGWRRIRNRVLGATTLLRPSAAKPVSVEPPTPHVQMCCSKGCGFQAHSRLSVGEGLYCCERCRAKPGSHDKGAPPSLCRRPV